MFGLGDDSSDLLLLGLADDLMQLGSAQYPRSLSEAHGEGYGVQWDSVTHVDPARPDKRGQWNQFGGVCVWSGMWRLSTSSFARKQSPTNT